MGQRRKAREYALQGIYMHEVANTPTEDVVKFDWTDVDLSDEIREFASKLVKGTLERINQIDDVIRKHSKNWTPERLSAIDRSILRLAIYEMIYLDDIPEVVTINESIELGKTFGGENSGQFINGILDAVKNTKS